ncbi:MAG TPA: TMEM175 family protein [Gemmatimonadaceae bacterium]|nr:TMEM175 family protein [Gemmatimonadaceae bacterium]
MRDGDFKVRGKDISRIEGLSDAVFGFAITLLAISLEVPKTSAEMLHALSGAVAFGVTFFMLFNIWRMQFSYFRRYGIEDMKLVWLTAVLLFVLLIYIFPLKFIITVLTNKLIYRSAFHERSMLAPRDVPQIFMAFGFGMAAVFAVFAAMYDHAYRLRDELQLTELETFETREFARNTTMISALGLAIGISYAISMLVPERYADPVMTAASVATVVFMLFIFRRRRTRGRRRRELRERMAQAVEA